MLRKSLITYFILLAVSGCMTNQQVKDGPSDEDDVPIGHSEGCWRSDYTLASESQYVLPYPVGNSYMIGQGNCGQFTHTKPPTISGDIRYAYDFSLPTGDKIVAARGGEVINVEDFFNNHSFDNYKTNIILIRHKDDTVALYAHLSPKGALVEVGDLVDQGQLIGISGQSGYAIDPHLHFSVFEKEHKECVLTTHIISNKDNYRLDGCKTIPITFKNAAPLDTPPRNGTIYTAKEY